MKKLLIIFGIVLLLLACGEIPETNEYTINYQSKNQTSGYPPIDDNKYTYGSYATVLGQHTLLRTKHEFDGWNTKQDYSGTHYNSGSSIKINKNIFLYAVWRALE